MRWKSGMSCSPRTTRVGAVTSEAAGEVRAVVGWAAAFVHVGGVEAEDNFAHEFELLGDAADAVEERVLEIDVLKGRAGSLCADRFHERLDVSRRLLAVGEAGER